MCTQKYIKKNGKKKKKIKSDYDRTEKKVCEETHQVLKGYDDG